MFSEHREFDSGPITRKIYPFSSVNQSQCQISLLSWSKHASKMGDKLVEMTVVREANLLYLNFLR